MLMQAALLTLRVLRACRVQTRAMRHTRSQQVRRPTTPARGAKHFSVRAARKNERAVFVVCRELIRIDGTSSLCSLVREREHKHGRSEAPA